MLTGGSLLSDWQFTAIALISVLLSSLIVLFSPLVPRFYGHAAIRSSVQAVHQRPTPRVGGIAIFGAIAFSFTVAQPQHWGSYASIVMGATVLFAAGLLEDLGFGVSPAKRLLAALGASLIVLLMTGHWLPKLGIPGADQLATYAVIGVPLTLLITAGLANAFNLIDGVNGMAGMTALGAAISFSAIASAAGSTQLVDLNLILIAAVLGFCVVNFPFGLVFLGDAGAYTLGFVLAWFGIAILIEIPDVSPWALLLCVFWPIADMLLAIFRRRQRKAAITSPDRLHVHQLVMRSLEVCYLSRSRRKIANPLTSVVLAPFVLTPPTAGVLLWNDNSGAFFAAVIFAVAFVISCGLLPIWVRRHRLRRAVSEDLRTETVVTQASRAV